MNTLKTSLIDVDKIEYDCLLPAVNEQRLELVRRCGGFVKSFVVYEYAPQKYRFIVGIDQLAIAVRLAEIDDEFEMIRCFHAKTEQEAKDLEENFYNF